MNMGRWVVAVALCGIAHAEPIYFDPRIPFARPMVPIAFAGKSGLAALDTGSGLHVLGASWVAPHASETLGIDWGGWPIQGFPLDGHATVLGWRAEPLFASEWAERPRLRPRGVPHTDAVVSPQLLPRS